MKEIIIQKRDILPHLQRWGTSCPFGLKRQLKKIETLYDKENDNFNELFCRMFCWSVTDTKEPPDYVYDRDTKQLYQPEF